MDWAQFATFMIVNMVFTLTLWLWSRAESRSDLRNIDNKLEIHQKDVNQIINAIHQEIKDFHGRLCAIEERNKREK